MTGTYAYRAVRQQFRRSWKMAQRMFCRKTKTVFWRGIHNLPERWEKCVESDGQYFE